MITQSACSLFIGWDSHGIPAGMGIRFE